MDPLPEKPERTTISASPDFAEAVSGVAKDAGLSVQDYLDREWLKTIQFRYAAVLRKKLAAVATEDGPHFANTDPDIGENGAG